MEIFAAVAVCCLGKHDDNAASFTVTSAASCPYGLINVLVQRIAPVCGYYDICGNSIHLTLGSQEIPALTMGQITVPCHCKDGVMAESITTLTIKSRPATLAAYSMSLWMGCLDDTVGKNGHTHA